jgi:hypothetical protein
MELVFHSIYRLLIYLTQCDYTAKLPNLIGRLNQLYPSCSQSNDKPHLSDRTERNFYLIVEHQVFPRERAALTTRPCSQFNDKPHLSDRTSGIFLLGCSTRRILFYIYVNKLCLSSFQFFKLKKLYIKKFNQ